MRENWQNRTMCRGRGTLCRRRKWHWNDYGSSTSTSSNRGLHQFSPRVWIKKYKTLVFHRQVLEGVGGGGATTPLSPEKEVQILGRVRTWLKYEDYFFFTLSPIHYLAKMHIFIQGGFMPAKLGDLLGTSNLELVHKASKHKLSWHPGWHSKNLMVWVPHCSTMYY